MKDFSEVVESLGNRIKKVLDNQEKLKQDNKALLAEVDALKQKNAQYEKEISNWQEENQSLKQVNSILGSDQYKRETKLKINALIREIDLCIAQLSV